MDIKSRFIEIYSSNIKRAGADKLLEYLESPASDFFTAPASARFHGAYAGGLAEHSINVYECLSDYMERDRVKNTYRLTASAESIAIAALLHDLCKINCYKPGFRNTKDETGKWIKVPTFEYDDKLPYGHGEKSVYIITGFMRLSREEAFAIRYHMGFSGTEDPRNVGNAFEMFPLAFALATADMEATYFLEGKS
ncbi:MAG: hydrolase [Clostridia bacterium]|nr:hydrolase [Clostridia bacterium]